jgi:hypothetical protein
MQGDFFMAYVFERFLQASLLYMPDDLSDRGPEFF